MGVNKLILKTLPVLLAKCLLGLLAFSIPVIFLFIFIGAGWFFGENGARIAIVLWLPFGAALHGFMLCHAGRLLEACHIIAAAEVLSGKKRPGLRILFGIRQLRRRFSSSENFLQFDKLLYTAIKQLYEQSPEKIALMREQKFIPINRFLTFAYLLFIRRYCLCRALCGEKHGPFTSAVCGMADWMKNQKTSVRDAEKILSRSCAAVSALILVFSAILGFCFARLNFYPLTALPVVLLAAEAVRYSLSNSVAELCMLQICQNAARSSSGLNDLCRRFRTSSESYSQMLLRAEEETERCKAESNPQAQAGRSVS